jgi:hypothetical protein
VSADGYVSNSIEQSVSSKSRWLRGLVIVAVTLAVSAITFAFSCYALQIPGMYRMARHGASAEGWITAKEPQNHGGLVVYSFKVDSRTYTGRGGIGQAFNTAKAGDQVSVVYDPTDPTNSSLGRTEENLWVTVGVSIFFSLVLGILGGGVQTGIVLHLWSRRRNRKAGVT